jgi:predicted anti-sigma-YlaC factor YlaD
MDCRKFREAHSLFIDDKCSELEEIEMRSHMRDCEACARHDAVVRRGLLMVRNLPTIEPSAGFRGQLNARLRAEARDAAHTEGAMGPTLARYAAIAAMLSGVSLALGRAVRHNLSADYRMAPVVASAPPREASPFGTTALVATVPTGMSIWPAILMASQAPAHFVTTELASQH